MVEEVGSNINKSDRACDKVISRVAKEMCENKRIYSNEW